MDRSERLTITEQDAGQSLVRQLAKFYRLKVAFWFKYADEERWHLNVTFETMTRDEFDRAFDRVRQILKGMGNVELDPFDMTFLEVQEPLVQWAIQLSDDNLTTSSHWRLPMHQGASVEGIFVYPKRDLIGNDLVAAELN